MFWIQTKHHISWNLIIIFRIINLTEVSIDEWKYLQLSEQMRFVSCNKPSPSMFFMFDIYHIKSLHILGLYIITLYSGYCCPYIQFYSPLGSDHLCLFFFRFVLVFFFGIRLFILWTWKYVTFFFTFTKNFSLKCLYISHLSDQFSFFCKFGDIFKKYPYLPPPPTHSTS